MSKADLIARLPYVAGELVLRELSRRDVDLRAEWPPYPPEFAPFNCTWGTLDAAGRDDTYAKRASAPRALAMSVDHRSQTCIAYIALQEVDWENGVAGNLGLRVHPHWCDRGVGTEIMRGFVAWCFSCGLRKLRHDVCALNARAVRCYEKAGYRVVGEFWHDDPFLAGLRPDHPYRADPPGHLRVSDGITQVRFFWMEIGA